MFLIILLSNIFLSFSISSEIDKTSLNLYSNVITSFLNNTIDDDILMKTFDENIEKFKDINISLPMFTQFSPIEIELTKNEFSIINEDLNSNAEFIHDKLFMVLCINSFLSGSFEFTYNEKELTSVHNNIVLNRKLNMLSHFNENYKSFQYGMTDLVKVDKGYFFINKYEDEIVLLCLNYSESNQQYLLDLSAYNIDIGLSLLDRSMIKINEGIAMINLSKYQTKIFNLKR